MNRGIRRRSIRSALSGGLLSALLLSVPVQAQAPRDDSAPAPVYRIELIVFEHQDGRSDRRLAAAPLDFTDALHPQLLALLDAQLERHLALLERALPIFSLPPRVGAQAPALVAGEERIQPVPRSYAAVELSPAMQRALERLQRSPEHRPVAAQAWFQTANPGQRTAAVRVHDETVVDWHRPEMSEDEPWLPEPVLLPDAEPPFAPVAIARPIHRLDGTVRLRRTQFLRLELDLVLQEARLMSDGGPADQRWQLHRVRRDRAVRPDRMEYFDSSRFGVLARITAFERVDPEPPEPPPPPMADPAPEPN